MPVLCSCCCNVLIVWQKYSREVCFNWMVAEYQIKKLWCRRGAAQIIPMISGHEYSLWRFTVDNPVANQYMRLVYYFALLIKNTKKKKKKNEMKWNGRQTHIIHTSIMFRFNVEVCNEGLLLAMRNFRKFPFLPAEAFRACQRAV